MPTLVDLGETWSSPTYEVRDTTGALVAGATVTATLTKPTGVTSTPSPSLTGTGTYGLDLLTDVEGTHLVTVTATGGPLGSIVRSWSDTYEVVRPGTAVVSADEVAQHLRATGQITGAADREQLRWVALVASRAVARDLRRALVREVVTNEAHSGGERHLKLRRTPVQSVTQVTESGVVLSATDGVDWTLDENTRTGLLWRGGTYDECGRWAGGRKNVFVSYVAGFGSLDPVIRFVVLTVAGRLWETTQQAGHPGLADDLGADAAVFAVTTSGLTPVQQSAYDSFRAWGMS